MRQKSQRSAIGGLSGWRGSVGGGVRGVRPMVELGAKGGD